MIARGYNLFRNLCDVHLKVSVSSEIDKKFILTQTFLEVFWQYIGVTFILTSAFCSGSLFTWTYVNHLTGFCKQTLMILKYKTKKDLDNFEIGG